MCWMSVKAEVLHEGRAEQNQRVEEQIAALACAGVGLRKELRTRLRRRESL
ncbi:rCG63040 [Rattus norvegicus]|uniref:RCG63040 n=1 Tax=Rattus norvegicus TaxID=10116 RepID=A6HW73_RAT|nr:rCG63040 [Rattus norvegicus]